jgi:hypothetical protein
VQPWTPIQHRVRVSKLRNGQLFLRMQIGFCTRERDDVFLIKPYSAEGGDELRDGEHRLGDGVRGCVLARCKCIASPQLHVPEWAFVASRNLLKLTLLNFPDFGRSSMMRHLVCCRTLLLRLISAWSGLPVEEALIGTIRASASVIQLITAPVSLGFALLCTCTRTSLHFVASRNLLKLTLLNFSDSGRSSMMRHLVCCRTLEACESEDREALAAMPAQ